MKKILYVLIGLFLIVPFNINVNALAKANVELTCDSTVKQTGKVKCKITLNVLEGVIKSFNGTLKGDNTYFQDGGGVIETGDFSGSNNVIKEVEVLALQKAGTGKITLKDIKATDDENNEITISEVSTTVKVLDNNSFLTNIKLDDKNIDTYGVTFAPNTTNYTINVTKKSSINISVEKSSTVSVTGIGTKNLTCGVNNIDIISTSEDKTNKTTYKLVINRSCDSDTTLKNIVISSGKLNPSYVASTRNYNVDVTKDIDKITISAVKNNDTQKVTGVVKDYALKFGENKFTITVVAENGSSKDYVITVNRQDTRSTNNNLKSLEIAEGRLNKEFKSDVLEYQMKVLYDVTKLNIKYETEEEHAKVVILGDVSKLKEGENNITLKVTSEKGDVKEYKIIVTRLKEGETLGDNPDISEINIKGYDINFSKNKQVYSLKIDNEKKLDIEIVLEDSTSSYKIVGNDNLKDGSIIKINTTSKDGSTREYQIIIEKENKTFLYIIGTILILSVLGLIVYVVISKIKENKNNPKPKKEKDVKVTTNVIKNKNKEDVDLEKIEKQLKEIEDKKSKLLDVTKPISIIPDNVNDLTNQEELKEIKEKQDNLLEEVNAIKEQIKEEGVKTCNICGHKILSSLEVCPYCKHKF